MEAVNRPEIVEDEHLEFLDDLRDLQEEFDVTKKDARIILLYWMDSGSERHGK